MLIRSREQFGRLLDRGWRVVATGFSFLVFGLLGLAYVPLGFLLLVGFPNDPVHRFTQRCTSRVFTFFLGLMKAVGVVRDVEFRKFDRLRRLNENNPLLIVANHPTLIDVIAVVSQFEQMDCVVKPEVWNNPLMGISVRAAGYVRDGDAVEVFHRCEERLDRGRSLFVFPEGTRSPEDSLQPFSRLPAQLSLATGQPIQPITIEYNHSTLRSDQSWYDVPPEPLKLTLTMHEPLEPDRGGQGSLKERSQQLTDDLREFYERELSFMDS